MASKKIKATKKITFNDLARHLFCIDCKKMVPGCVPDLIFIYDDLVELGMKTKISIECHYISDKEVKTEIAKIAKPRQPRKTVRGTN